METVLLGPALTYNVTVVRQLLDRSVMDKIVLLIVIVLLILV